jgi:hypothetical protein
MNTTSHPIGDPVDDSPVRYCPGLLNTQENGMILSRGLKSRLLACTREFITYHDGKKNAIPDDNANNPG